MSVKLYITLEAICLFVLNFRTKGAWYMHWRKYELPNIKFKETERIDIIVVNDYGDKTRTQVEADHVF